MLEQSVNLLHARTYPGDQEAQLVLLPGGGPCYPIYPISRDLYSPLRKMFSRC